MKNNNLNAAILFIIISFSTSLSAGAWTQKANGGFYKLGVRYISATNYYDKEGKKNEIPKLTNLFLSLYSEYGATDQLTIIANLSVLESIKIEDQEYNGILVSKGSSNSGLADSEIGARYRIWQGEGSLLSTELFLGIPIGNSKNRMGLNTGDGEFNQILNILYGKSFYPLPSYLSAQVGFNNRNAGFSDEIKYAIEIGYNLYPSILLALKIHGVETLENGSKNVLGGMYGLHSNNQKYLAFGPELSYSFANSMGFAIGFESAANAANVLSAIAYSIGIYFKN
jgi:hypothetical protein